MHYGLPCLPIQLSVRPLICPYAFSLKLSDRSEPDLEISYLGPGDSQFQLYSRLATSTTDSIILFSWVRLLPLLLFLSSMSLPVGENVVYCHKNWMQLRRQSSWAIFDRQNVACKSAFCTPAPPRNIFRSNVQINGVHRHLFAHWIWKYCFVSSHIPSLENE